MDKLSERHHKRSILILSYCVAMFCNAENVFSSLIVFLRMIYHRDMLNTHSAIVHLWITFEIL